MNELEKKVLEHEERLLAIVSGNINIMSRLEKIEHDINKLKNDTENVLDILKQRDDELNDDMSKMKEYYLSLNYDIDRIISVMKKNYNTKNNIKDGKNEF